MKKIVFTAHSKETFYCRDTICKFVLSKGYIPLNPFKLFDYYLNRTVEENIIRDSNNRLIMLSDKLWIFGDKIADGVFKEILFAREFHKPIKFFSISSKINEIKEYEDWFLGYSFHKEVYDEYNFKKDELVKIILGRK